MPSASAAATPSKGKKSTKKQFPVVAIVTPDGIEGTFSNEPRRPLIAHIPVHSAEVTFYNQPLRYDPAPPTDNVMPYDAVEEEYTFTGAGQFEENNHYDAPAPEAGTMAAAAAAEEIAVAAAAAAKEETITKPLPVYTKKELLVQFKGTHTTRKLPEKVDVACQWCCHVFDGQPAVIPVCEERGVWEVYGCFCCPECALSYLLAEKEDTHVRWERVALMHALYNKGSNTRIYPAPTREILKIFGGHLTIEAYRAMIAEKKVRVDVHMPPMVSILATIDTKPIDFYETTVQKSYVPINTERVQKAEEGLRLKRSKPLKDKESTLDSCINLQIRKATPIGFD